MRLQSPAQRNDSLVASARSGAVKEGALQRLVLRRAQGFVRRDDICYASARMVAVGGAALQRQVQLRSLAQHNDSLAASARRLIAANKEALRRTSACGTVPEQRPGGRKSE